MTINQTRSKRINVLDGNELYIETVPRMNGRLDMVGEVTCVAKIFTTFARATDRLRCAVNYIHLTIVCLF